MNQKYYRVSGQHPCGFCHIIYPANHEDAAVMLFAKDRPNINKITAVRLASKSEYDTQENNKRNAESEQENLARWNRILRESK